MKYTREQACGLIDSFNKKDFIEKLNIIKEHKSILELEYDNGWCLIHLVDCKDLEEEMRDDDYWFDFEGEAFINNEYKLLRWCRLLE